MIEDELKNCFKYRKVGDIFEGKPNVKTSVGHDYLELCLGGDLINWYKKEKPKDTLSINASFLHKNIWQECYREIMVSYIHMLPLLKKTVGFKDADYILYMHPYARCDDLGQVVLEEIRWIDKNRKKGAEIIVLGKATNVENDLEKDEIDNITYVPSHFCEYLGTRFNIDMREQYVVYDDQLKQLSIWPVDGCKNKCNFCRRSYMDIPFESQTLEFLKQKLDWFKENEPGKMKTISLRAENLTQYGIDLYDHRACLDKVLKLLISYDEIEEIEIPIGLCIGEMTEEVIDTICSSNKFKSIALNLEAASDRLNKLCGKKHTMEQARDIFYRIRNSNPSINIGTTVMLGIPTESVGEVELFADYLNELGLDYIHCNFYQDNKRDGFKNVKKLSDQCKYYHLKLFKERFKKVNKHRWYIYRDLHSKVFMHFRNDYNQKHTRKNARENQKLENYNLSHPSEFPLKHFGGAIYTYFGPEEESIVKLAREEGEKSGQMLVDIYSLLLKTGKKDIEER